MNYKIISVMLFIAYICEAQQKKLLVKDSSGVKSFTKFRAPTNKYETDLLLKKNIEIELNNIVALYSKDGNNQSIWVKIENAAENLLYPYFLNGQLLGSQKDQAYFIKLGMETMTAADIANKKMILLVGIATIKPSEFHIITVTKNFQ